MTQPISTVQPYNGPQKAAEAAYQQYLATNGTEGVLFGGAAAWDDSQDITREVEVLLVAANLLPHNVGLIFTEEIQMADGKFCTGVCIVAQPDARTSRL